MEAKLDFGHGIDHLNQIVSHDRLVYFGFIFEQAGMLSKEKAVVTKPQVAFGVRQSDPKPKSESPAKIRQQGYSEMVELDSPEPKFFQPVNQSPKQQP